MMEELYELLRHNYLAIDWYLHKHVFPETMRFQELKVSACGQVLGAANMLFHRRLGFSGTPSDMLPIDLGSCRYDEGIDGSIIHTLASTNIVSALYVGKKQITSYDTPSNNTTNDNNNDNNDNNDNDAETEEKAKEE